MTKSEFRQKSKQLKKEVAKLIDNRIEKVLQSGCIDLDQYENNFLLPKIFISAIGEEIKFQFKPHDKKSLKDRDNMIHFL